jgi:hypothetical protein
MSNLYSIRKVAALYTVCMPSGMIVFRSLSRKRCEDFIEANSPKEIA